MTVTETISLLLIEDSPHDVELVLVVLERAGLRVDAQVARNRDALLQALSERTFDLIICDFILPGFTGSEALQIAQALAKDTPVLFLSGVFGEEHAVEMMRLGAVDYVLKQNMSLLPKAVNRALAEIYERRERQRMTHELARVELRARLALDAAKQGLWEYEPQTGQLSWDPRCKRMFGLSEDVDVSFALFRERCLAEDWPRVQQAIDRAMASGGDSDYDIEFRVKPNGLDVRWLASRGHAYFEGAVCTRFLGVITDITEQKQAAQTLERLNAILGERVERRTRERNRTWELTRDLLGVLDSDSRACALNPAWGDVLGWPRSSLLGQPLLQLLHPDDVNPAQQELERLGQGWPTARFVSRLRHADGSYRSISWGAVPDEGQIHIVGRDITSEIAIIDELAETNRKLRTQIAERERVEATLHQMQRLEAVGQLTAGVAHDFNNLLTVILVNATFLERELVAGQTGAKTASRLQNIREAGERGARLTSQLLAFSRRQQLAPVAVNLNETLAGMLDLLRSTLGGGVWIQTHTCDDLWHALVDPTQIELIVLNLAINARDAMGVGGTLHLTTSNVCVIARPERPEDPEPGEYVVLSVADTGSGMSEEVLAKAFEPFFTTKDVGKGSGLGLAQVFGFAKQSGGGARIDTELGVGTTVHVYLPRAARADEVPALTPELPLAGHHGSRRRVLVVDDDPQVREVTAAMLEQLGYRVHTCDSGPNAMLALEDGAGFDLLLADYAMPGMNGGELAALVNVRFPGLPVVFVTGYAELGRLDAGEALIVQKPFSEDVLAQAVHAALARKIPYMEEL